MQDVRKRAKSNDKNVSERNIPKNNESNDYTEKYLLCFQSKNDKVKTFAKQSELLPGKGLVVDCSPSYKEEVEKYEGCVPKECKRSLIKEAEELLAIAKKGLKLGGSSGGASILDLHSGALSMGQHFVVKEKIKYAVAHHFGVKPNKIYLTHPTFFSEITSKKAVTMHDEYWHPHVDKETYKSFHYTTLLYLGDYNIDFKGGRFVFVDEKFNRTVEPRKARLSMFTSGRENLHYVEKVTSGNRYAMTISFTCDQQYAIQDPSINNI
ncbi:hypothetical protein HW555_009867 [Spodoptera exigua]|uniref:Prolyl 4-hydroxylase alpha subunit domain-containing protein n=1 Tax=Spodoptera exigua TaxID=7107 RepID=A0A835GAF5_SPOEX|nr:hypothetical protein HW555_009867 [Spodoptera exigua]